MEHDRLYLQLKVIGLLELAVVSLVGSQGWKLQEGASVETSIGLPQLLLDFPLSSFERR